MIKCRLMLSYLVYCFAFFYAAVGLTSLPDLCDHFTQCRICS